MKSIFALALMSLSWSVVAHAECPQSARTIDGAVKYISAAQGQCGEALNRASECSWGSSADGQIAGAAITVCESKFLSKLSATEKAGYSKLQGRCGKKYEGQQGTMYRSMEAFCEAEVSLHFAQMMYSFEQAVE